jgi:hypothetical protein
MSEPSKLGEEGETKARPDPLRAAFGAAIEALMENLPEGEQRKVAVIEMMEAHHRAAAALARRRMN